MKVKPQITIETFTKSYHIDVEALCKLLGVPSIKDVHAIKTTLSQGDKSIIAYAFPGDGAPFVVVDGATNENYFYFASVMMPNENAPNDFVAQLYAGGASYEVDCPIAMVKSCASGRNPSGEAYSAGKGLTKIVYVDPEVAVAQYRTWGENLPTPEHAEG